MPKRRNPFGDGSPLQLKTHIGTKELNTGVSGEQNLKAVYGNHLFMCLSIQIYIPLPSVALTSMHVRCAPKANIDAKLKQCMPLTIHVFIPNCGKFQIPKLFLMKEF